MHAKLTFCTLHTIPQQISAPSTPHFTFRNSAFYRDPHVGAPHSIIIVINSSSIIF